VAGRSDGAVASVFDVALLAKVSVATASRVLSGSEYPVRPKTRDRVLEAAKALSYSPNALAKAMVTGRTRIVGVIVGDATDPYFAAIVRGIEDVARQQGYLVVVCNSDRIPEIELQYLRALNDHRVDGVIFAGGGLVEESYVRQTRESIGAFSARGAACVTLGRHMFPSYRVLIDNEQLVRDAVMYLADQGHERIVFLSGPPLLTTTRLRLDGYRSAMTALGFGARPEDVLEGDYTFEAGIRAAQIIAGMERRPTAVLASNDIMAMGCIVGFKGLGCRVPDDISVMGIDDIPTAIVVDPPLTTVAIPLHQLGVIGMESLLRLRAGELNLDEEVTLPHSVVVRGSVAELGRRARGEALAGARSGLGRRERQARGQAPREDVGQVLRQQRSE
jgi:LacI family transcriptional regulator